MSSVMPVTSGVPQGSIIGPLLFVLFINDISEGINEGTNTLIYADDTKIWREIHVNNDHILLQLDIDYLLDWALQNNIKFNIPKCKVLSFSHYRSSLLENLSFTTYYYRMNEKFLDYCKNETDLGILMTPTLNFSDHSDKLYSKACQRLGLLKRTCHFVNNLQMRTALYLSIVRSIFEHCPYIWKPSSDTTIKKLESLQKRAIKWVLLGDMHFTSPSYTANPMLYLTHCKQLNILPIKLQI